MATWRVVLCWAIGIGGCGGGGLAADAPAGGSPDAPSSPGCSTPIPERTIHGGVHVLAPAVAAGPDADGDGHPDVVMGDPTYLATNAIGAVHLVSGATGGILHTWIAEETDDAFGASVSLGPDVDGDGLADVLVGASWHDRGRGRVYLWSGATGALLHSWDGADAAAQLGIDAVLGPDVDGDGRGDVLISDRLRYDTVIDGDVIHSRVGRVYLYSGRTYASLATLDAPARNSAPFGAVVSLGPDLDGDGAGDILATATLGTGMGAVRAYSGASRVLLHEWTTEGGFSLFNSGASLGPDADGDGKGDVAIAASGDSHVERVVLYSGASNRVVQSWSSDNWRPIRGHHLSVTTDLDGDDRADVVFAADTATSGPGEPAITIFVESGGTGAEIASWSYSDRRYYYAGGAAGIGDRAGCGALVAYGWILESPFDPPTASAVELRRLISRRRETVDRRRVPLPDRFGGTRAVRCPSRRPG